MKRETVLVKLLFLCLLYIFACNAGGCVGYEEKMSQYMDENGCTPDIYGYGWEK